MRTTRAYAAGFGTAGSMLAVAAILFVLGSAIIAFQGWPRIASQGSPAVVQISAAPASPSRVSRRLRAVAAPAHAAAVARPAASGLTRSGRPATRPVSLSGPTGAAPSGGSLGGGHGVTRAGSGTKPGSGAPGRIIVSTPTTPPVTVTVPAGAVPDPVKSVVKKVTSTAESPSPSPTSARP